MGVESPVKRGAVGVLEVYFDAWSDTMASIIEAVVSVITTFSKKEHSRVYLSQSQFGINGFSFGFRFSKPVSYISSSGLSFQKKFAFA